MMSRAVLSAEHDAIVAIAGEIGEAIAAEPLDGRRIAQLRWRLAHALSVHLAKEDRHIYPSLKRHSDPRLARLATAFEQEMGGLHEGYRAYMEAWDVARIEAEPATFRRETRDLLKLLARRVAREEQELYPLYERA